MIGLSNGSRVVKMNLLIALVSYGERRQSASEKEDGDVRRLRSKLIRGMTKTHLFDDGGQSRDLFDSRLNSLDNLQAKPVKNRFDSRTEGSR